MSRSLFPNAHTEIAILWRSPGVREFRPIAMPCDQGIVDWRPVRRAGFVAFGGECRVPHSDDRIGIVRNEQERTWLDSSQPMPPLRVKARRQPDGIATGGISGRAKHASDYDGSENEGQPFEI
jgi:hypothetical protein